MKMVSKRSKSEHFVTRTREYFSWSKFTAFQKILCAGFLMLMSSMLTRWWPNIIVFCAGVGLSNVLISFFLKQKNPIKSEYLLYFVRSVNSVRELFYKSDRGKIVKRNEEDKNEDASRRTSEVDKEIEKIVRHIKRDFFESWFSPFTDHDSVSLESYDALIEASETIKTRIRRVESEKCARDIIDLFRRHISSYQVSKCTYESLKEPKLRSSSSASLVTSRLVRAASIEEAYEIKFNFHPALINEETEIKYLQNVIKLLLCKVMPDSFIFCCGVQLLLNEILLTNVVKKLVDKFSTPYFLYWCIVKLTSENLPELGEDAVSETVENSDRFSSLSKSGEIKSQVLNSGKDNSLIERSLQCDGSSRTSENQPREDNSDDELRQARGSNSSELEPGSDDQNTNNDITIPLTLIKNCTTVIPTISVSDGGDAKRDNSDTHIAEDFFKERASQVDEDRVSLMSDHSNFSQNSDNLSLSSNTDVFHDVDKSDEDDHVTVNPIPLANQNPKSDEDDHMTVNPIPLANQNPKSKLEILMESVKLKLSNNKSEIESTENTAKEVSFFLQDGTSDVAVATNTDVSHDVEEEEPVVDDDSPILMDSSFIFQGVQITDTESATEYRSQNQYTLYIIQFEAMYFSDSGPVMRSGTVKRRFREFVNLNSRLDNNSYYKNLLKDIKGPRRWQNLPFKNMDKESVESRKTFLDQFLKSLIEIEAICNGPELREFLAYEGDSHIAFVKKPNEISVPRIDKMFVRTVSGMFDRIKSLPSLSQDVISGIVRREPSVDRKLEDKSPEMDKIELEFDHQESANLAHLSKFLDFCDIAHITMETEKSTGEGEQRANKLQEDMITMLPRIQGDGSESPDLPNETEVQPQRESTDLHLAHSVLDLALQIFEGHDLWLSKQRVFHVLRLSISRALQRFLKDEIQELTSETQWTFYLSTLRDTFWPHGVLSTEEEPEKSESEINAMKRLARDSLVEFFPGWLQSFIGPGDMVYAADEIIQSLGYSRLNKNLVFTLLDYVIEELFPEVCHQELQATLLSSS